MKSLSSVRFHFPYSVRIHSSAPSLNRNKLWLEQKALLRLLVPVPINAPFLFIWYVRNN